MVNIKRLTFLALQFISIYVAADDAPFPETSLVRFNNRTLKTTSRLKAGYDLYAGRVFNVEAYGAVGNGIQDNTQAFAIAWNVACKASKAVLLVPGKKIFQINNSVFQGPCSPGFTFKIEGTITAPQDPAKWNNTNAVDFANSSWITVAELTITKSPSIHLTFNDCEFVRIRAVQIMSPAYSMNTDGIDILTSKNFEVIDCVISTGDDCMALGNGSSHILIRNLTCGPGHGISIGSLGKFNSSAEVSTIHIDGAKLTETQNGVRIKTWQGGSGMISDIQFKNIEMVNVHNPIIIDQYYCANTPNLCHNQ
ncbi:hypothetical protein KI387_010499, partial [Taxus chinensis]